MIKTVVPCLFLLLTMKQVVNAQSHIIVIDSAKNIRIDADTVKKIKKVYIAEFSDLPPIITKYLYFDPKTILTGDLLSKATEQEVGAELNIELIMVLKFAPNTKFLTLNEVLKIYNIDPKYWLDPVLLDNEHIDYPQTMFFSKNQIADIKVIDNGRATYIKIDLKW